MENEKKQKANAFNTGIASEYLVLSFLYRRGVEAYLSQGNKKSIDIRIIKSNNTTISVDVKAVRGYSSLVVNNVKPQKNHFIVFVIYNGHFETLSKLPDFFIVPSSDLFEQNLISSFKTEKRVMKGSIDKYINKWDYIIEDYNE